MSQTPTQLFNKLRNRVALGQARVSERVRGAIILEHAEWHATSEIAFRGDPTGTWQFKSAVDPKRFDMAHEPGGENSNG